MTSARDSRKRAAPAASRRGQAAGRSSESTRGGVPTETASGFAAVPGWVWAVAIVLVVIVYFYPLIFMGQVFSSPDAQAPQGFAVYAAEWRARTGEYPLWNPFMFCGLPSYAALAYNPDVYFPDWIFALLGGLAPPMLWLIVYYMIGALALYALLGDHGAARAPAALGGLLFALAPNLIAVGAHGHGSQLVNSGLIPVALLALHRFLARGRATWLSLLALTLGAQVLRGHVQIAYYTWLAIAIYLVYYLLDRRRGGTTFVVAPRRGLGGVGAALALGALLGAVLALPVAAYAPHSIRGGGATGGVSFDYATGWSLGLGELWTMIVPSALGFGGETYWGTMPFTDYPNAYIGIITLFFGAMVFLIPAGRRRQPGWSPAVFYLALAALGLLIALGKNFFLYDLLYRFLPYWKKFRVPVMILVLTHLALAGLFALGLTRLLRLAVEGGPGASRLARLMGWKTAAMVAVFVLVILLGGSFRDRYSDAFRQSPRIAAQLARAPDVARQLGSRAAGRAHKDLLVNVGLVAAAGALGAMLLSRRLRPELFVGGVAILLALDVVPIGYEIMRPLITSPSDLVKPTAPDDVVEFLRAKEGPFRIYPLEEFRSNRFATFGIASVGGYHAAKPRAYQEFMDAFGIETFELFSHPDRYRLLDLLNVRYLVTAAEAGDNPRFRKVHDGPMKIYENLTVGPRAFTVGEAEVVPTAAAALARLGDPEFDLSRRAVVATAVGPLGGPDAVGRATVKEFELNRVVVEVTAEAPVLLVLADVFDPGWQAQVDGARSPVIQTDHIFRGVRVDSGAHEVEFHYVAPGLRLGFLLSLVSGAGILLMAAISLIHGRRGSRMSHQGGEVSG